MMQFPERQNVYYIETFCGRGDGVGITDKNQYIYINHTGSTDWIELREISYEQYLDYLCHYQEPDSEFYREIWQKPCIAFQSSHYEPNPVNLIPYGSENWQEYFDFIRNHIVTDAKCSGNTVIFKTEQGETLILTLNQGGNHNGK
ncbi:MAG: hypothetical protein IJJ69_01835 [Oscillospiraceae bacterium]|nr:hypothetical protein [Oscillospiraceae bacterium]